MDDCTALRGRRSRAPAAQGAIGDSSAGGSAAAFQRPSSRTTASAPAPVPGCRSSANPRSPLTRIAIRSDRRSARARLGDDVVVRVTRCMTAEHVGAGTDRCFAAAAARAFLYKSSIGWIADVAVRSHSRCASPTAQARFISLTSVAIAAASPEGASTPKRSIEPSLPLMRGAGALDPAGTGWGTVAAAVAPAAASCPASCRGVRCADDDALGAAGSAAVAVVAPLGVVDGPAGRWPPLPPHPAMTTATAGRTRVIARRFGDGTAVTLSVAARTGKRVRSSVDGLAVAGYRRPMDRTLIINLADAPALSHPDRATMIDVEPDDAPWPDTGVNVQVMEPGQPNCKYHSEPVQEDFLVLHGECIAIVDGEERRLRQWDLLHCPAGVEHVFVGAGEGPCAVLMIGSRRRDEAHYPVDDTAARYGASVAAPTDDPAVAYAEWRRHPRTPTANPWPLG